MDTEKKKILDGLEEMNRLMGEKQRLLTEMENIEKRTDEKYGLNKPKRPVAPKKIKEPSKPNDTDLNDTELNPPKKNTASLAIVSVVLIAIGVIFAAMSKIFMFVIFAFAGLMMIFLMKKVSDDYNAKVKQYKALIEKKENHEKEMLEYAEKLKIYNNEQELYLKKKELYLKKRELYNSELDKYKLKHEELLEKEKHNLQELIDLQNKKIEEFDCGVSEKFYEDIPQLIEVIKDGRADNLKEGINILISDKKQNELIKAQYEYNEKKLAIEKTKTEAMVRQAEEQTYAMEQQAEAMREQAEHAKRQADAVKEQEEARKRNAPSCYLCANYPCGGKPAYCGSFLKKQ